MVFRGARAAERLREPVGRYNATGFVNPGLRLFGRRMRFGFRCAEIGHADPDAAIRIRAGGRRGEDLERTSLHDTLRSCRAGDRLDGDLRAQGLRVTDDTGQTRAAGRYPARSRGRNKAATAVRSEPRLRRTRKERLCAPAGAQTAAETQARSDRERGEARHHFAIAAADAPAFKAGARSSAVRLFSLALEHGAGAGYDVAASAERPDTDPLNARRLTGPGPFRKSPRQRDGRLAQRESVPFTRERS